MNRPPCIVMLCFRHSCIHEIGAAMEYTKFYVIESYTMLVYNTGANIRVPIPILSAHLWNLCIQPWGVSTDMDISGLVAVVGLAVDCQCTPFAVSSLGGRTFRSGYVTY